MLKMILIDGDDFIYVSIHNIDVLPTALSRWQEARASWPGPGGALCPEWDTLRRSWTAHLPRNSVTLDWEGNF